MDVATMQGLIGSMGFPIVMCLALLFYGKKGLDTLTQSVDANTKMMMVIATTLKVDVKDSVQ